MNKNSSAPYTCAILLYENPLKATAQATIRPAHGAPWNAMSQMKNEKNKKKTL